MKRILIFLLFAVALFGQELFLNNNTVSISSNGEILQGVATISVSDTTSLTAAQCYGTVIYVTGTTELDLPAIADGMNFSVITIGAVAVSIDPDDADLIVLDGTAKANGAYILNTSTAGDIAVMTYYSADGWHATTNTWTGE